MLGFAAGKKGPCQVLLGSVSEWLGYGHLAFYLLGLLGTWLSTSWAFVCSSQLQQLVPMFSFR